MRREMGADDQELGQEVAASEAWDSWNQAAGPLLDFLERNSSPASLERFAALSLEMREEDRTHTGEPGKGEQAPNVRRFDVLLPSFATTELTEAFQIGFLILLPFLVLDLVVAALLQAMGLATMQPSTLSLPLKLLLFVLVDGWQLILEGLLSGYV